MTLNIKNSIVTVKRQQYFKSWSSYHIPMRPVKPIMYNDTEQLVSYYLAFYDDENNLVKFIKYLRKSQSAGSIALVQMRKPKATLYFEAVTNTENHLSPGKELNFSSTENPSVYYRGVVDEEGRSVNLELIQKTVFFTDEYSYWPNKKLKERAMQKKDGSIIHSSYGESGKELPQQPVKGEVSHLRQ